MVLGTGCAVGFKTRWAHFIVHGLSLFLLGKGTRSLKEVCSLNEDIQFGCLLIGIGGDSSVVKYLPSKQA